MQDSRRKFLAGAAITGFGMAMTLPAHPANAALANGDLVLTVGGGGKYADIASALAQANSLGPSQTVSVVILLLPGAHTLSTVVTVPSWVSIIGSGEQSSLIDCIGNYSGFKVNSNQVYADFAIRATRTSNSSQKGIFVSSAASASDLHFENVSAYLKGGYQQVWYINYFSTINFKNITCFTTSIGILATGYLYLDNPRIHLSGDATGTPYIGLTCLAASNAVVRYYINGGFIGTGYGATKEGGFGKSGTNIMNDGTQPVIGIYVQASHTPNLQTGSRIQANGLESYARNESNSTGAAATECIRIDGYAYARLYGGLFQAETPAWTTGRDYAVYVSPLDPITGGLNPSRAELYSARVSTFGGNVSGGLKTDGLLVVDSDYIVNRVDGGTLLVDASAGPVTLTLPSTSNQYGPHPGMLITIKRIDNMLGNAVTIKAGNGNTIEGMVSLTLDSQYAFIRLVYGVLSSGIWYEV
ncbi:MAG: hypothetical protein ACRERU_02785 [Methylococcales bacterium]